MTRRTVTRAAVMAALCAALVAGLLTGCGQQRPGLRIDYNNELEPKLANLIQHGQSAALRDLTDFRWDEVHLFRGLSREMIDKVIGAPAFSDKNFDPEVNLLIFEDQQVVVKAIGVQGMLTAAHPSWPANVVLEPWQGLLRFALPNANG